VTLHRLCTTLDGAWHYLAVAHAGTQGLTTTRHGAPDRWDWGMTMDSLQIAQERHVRLQNLADSLTPEQRMAVWQDPSEQAKQLRRFVR